MKKMEEIKHVDLSHYSEVKPHHKKQLLWRLVNMTVQMLGFALLQSVAHLAVEAFWCARVVYGRHLSIMQNLGTMESAGRRPQLSGPSCRDI